MGENMEYPPNLVGGGWNFNMDYNNGENCVTELHVFHMDETNLVCTFIWFSKSFFLDEKNTKTPKFFFGLKSFSVLNSRSRGCGFELHSVTALNYVLEQDTVILALVLVQPRKTHPNITEKLLTGT